MHISSPSTGTRKALAAAAAAALALTGIGALAAPAQAAGPFELLSVDHDSAVFTDGSCTWQPTVMHTPDPHAISANTSLTTKISGSTSGVGVSGAGDQMRFTIAETSTVTSSTKNGAPQSLRLSYAGSAATAATAGASTCKIGAWAESAFSFRVTVTRPTWATLSLEKAPGSYLTAEIHATNLDAPGSDDTLAKLYGGAAKVSGSSSTILLPSGTYEGELRSHTYLNETAVSRSVSTRGSAAVAFAAAGSAVSGPSGKAQSYAALGSARSCSTGTLAAKITTSKTRAKAIRSVKFAVNGKTVKTLTGRAVKRGLGLKLKLSATQQASVTTTVKLKSGSTRTAKAVYRACA